MKLKINQFCFKINFFAGQKLQNGSPESISKINLSPDRILLKSPTESRSKSFTNALNESPRKSNAENSKILKPHEIDLGITLVAISMMFILCQSIKVIPDINEIINCDHFELALKENEMDRICTTTVIMDTFASLGNLFCCINSASNFLLYMLRGKKFRDAFHQTYFSWISNEAGSGIGRSNSPIGFSLQTLDQNTRVTTVSQPHRLSIVTMRNSVGRNSAAIVV